MTKDELLSRLQDIEWEDFEVKSASRELPKNIWESVSAFSNGSGGWIVFGVVQNGKRFEVEGVNNGEKIESDFLNTLRSGNKMNHPILPISKKYSIEGKTVLAFYIPSSPFKPVWYTSITNTFIRSGSGDRRATEMEVNAMLRDQAFGIRSDESAADTSFEDIDPGSFDTFRRHIKLFNESYPYADADDNTFCSKTGIYARGGSELSVGGLLMLGKLDSIHRVLPSFWVDYIEVPGTSYNDASQRYTFRMQEQENLWEYYKVIIQRFRLYTDNPFTTTPDGVSPEDESQLYALKEGLVNFLAHSDYFSPMHPTIRVYTDRIELQNPGSFHIPIDRLLSETISQPRNPAIIKLFRAAKLGENAGYGIDKIRKWKSLTGMDVTFSSEIAYSTVTYYRINPATTGKTTDKTTNKTTDKTYSGVKEVILRAMQSSPSITIEELSVICHLSQDGVRYHIKYLKSEGIIRRVGKKGGYWEILK